MAFNSVALVRRALSIRGSAGSRADYFSSFNAVCPLAKHMHLPGDSLVRNSSTLVPPDAGGKVSQDISIVKDVRDELVRELSRKDHEIQRMQAELENNRVKLLEAYEKQAYNKLLDDMMKMNQEMKIMQFELEEERQKNSQKLVELTVDHKRKLSEKNKEMEDALSKYVKTKFRLNHSMLANMSFLMENTLNNFMEYLCSEGCMDGCKYNAELENLWNDEDKIKWFHSDGILLMFKDACVAFLGDSSNLQGQSLLAHIKSLHMTTEQFINNCAKAYCTAIHLKDCMLSSRIRCSDDPFKEIQYVTIFDEEQFKKEHKACVEIVASYFASHKGPSVI